VLLAFVLDIYIANVLIFLLINSRIISFDIIIFLFRRYRYNHMVRSCLEDRFCRLVIVFSRRVAGGGGS
jgi:hypothetical protein